MNSYITEHLIKQQKKSSTNWGQTRQNLRGELEKGRKSTSSPGSPGSSRFPIWLWQIEKRENPGDKVGRELEKTGTNSDGAIKQLFIPPNTGSFRGTLINQFLTYNPPPNLFFKLN